VIVVVAAAVALLGVKPPTPTPAPATASSRSRPTPAVAPSPTPTPELRDPHLVAALFSSQGDGAERVAVFDDGTLVLVDTYKGYRTVRRKSLSPEEVDLVRKVTSEALVVSESTRLGAALTEASARRVGIEVADPPRGLKTFTYDDTSELPLSLGRARGALEDLRSRFFKPDPKEIYWDPSGVKARQYLRLRSDGRWFRVVRDDAIDENMELEEVEGGMRLFVVRGGLPNLFEDPATAKPPVTPLPR
jgi:hypothetical protein